MADSRRPPAKPMTKAQIVEKIAKLLESARKAGDPEVKRLLLSYVRTLRQRIRHATYT